MSINNRINASARLPINSPSGAAPAPKSAKSSIIERSMLAITLALLPLQSNLPLYRGYSTLFGIFGVLLIYLFLCRPAKLARTASHPLFLAIYGFLAIILIIDLVHGSPDIYGIMRIGFMCSGALAIAAVCRDKKALKAGIYGYLAGCLVMTLMLLFSSYIKISAQMAGGSYYDASVFRANALKDRALKDNLNATSMFLSQAAVLAFAASLDKKGLRMQLLLAIAALCMVGSFITMSRGGVVIFVLALGAMLYAYGICRPRIILLGAFMALVIIMAVPSTVFRRLTIGEARTATGNFEDSRAHLYSDAIEYSSRYFLTGVGMGKFYGEWGMKSKFNTGSGWVTGVHNCIFQVIINWGVLGLLAFLRIIWCSFSAFPRSDRKDVLRLCVLGVSISALTWAMFVNEFETKEFSLALGLLAASQLWIWPPLINTQPTMLRAPLRYLHLRGRLLERNRF